MILEELSPRHSNHSGDALGITNRGPDFSANDAMEVRLFTANLAPDEAQGPALFVDDGSKVFHASNFVIELQKVKGIDSGHFAGSLHDSNMPKWRYRDAFDAEYKAFRKRTGWTVDQVAEALGKTEGAVIFRSSALTEVEAEALKVAAAETSKDL